MSDRMVEALLVALPETAGSALYGMVDVLSATGTLWHQFVGDTPGHPLIQPRILSVSREPFRCGNGIPVQPDVGLDEETAAQIVIVPELWLAPDDDLSGRYPELMGWLCRRYQAMPYFFMALRKRLWAGSRSVSRLLTSSTIHACS